ncbi:alpha/beta fold hydrolase [Evansella sp. AB-rgal1]|uniref:alpha/beta fold hydrolase n=1 Tax=Evansella sp. AB-rgal1 TaxID=3242696 RepID=UPI00359CC3CF
MSDTDFYYIKTNGITLYTAVAGPKEGLLVILLHGFPEFWYAWKNQIDVLAEAGYRVVVPDQRGYHLSDKPKEIDQYTLDKLRDDVIGLLEHFEREKAVIIGHDWGALVAWHIASTRPEIVEKLIPINAPNPVIFTKNMIKHPSQLIRSSYMLFFQTPIVPEKILSANHFTLVKETMIHSANPQTFTKKDLEQYEASWSIEGAFMSMLHWYRALREGSISQLSEKQVTVPVRMIWGRNDSFLSLELAKESMNICRDGKLIMVDEATHWVHHEQPRILNWLLLSMIQERVFHPVS